MCPRLIARGHPRERRPRSDTPRSRHPKPSSLEKPRLVTTWWRVSQSLVSPAADQRVFWRRVPQGEVQTSRHSEPAGEGSRSLRTRQIRRDPSCLSMTRLPPAARNSNSLNPLNSSRRLSGQPSRHRLQRDAVDRFQIDLTDPDQRHDVNFVEIDRCWDEQAGQPGIG